MIANPALIGLAETHWAALLAAAQIGLGLALMSNAIISKRAGALRLGLFAGGLALIFARLVL